MRATIGTLKLLALLAFAFFQTTSAATLPTLPPKLFSTRTCRSGAVVLELRGEDDGLGFPTQAWLVVPSGKRSLLVVSETYILAADISGDGRYVVLIYHISSGGYAEAFVRGKSGGYRKMLDNSYALEQIQKGRVLGLHERDLGERRGRNMHCGLHLAHAPERLVFTFDERVEVFYSLEQRRISGWRRSLLKCAMEQEGIYAGFALSLDEFSGQRGVTLTASESRRDGSERRERLVTLPVPKGAPLFSEPSNRLRLDAGKATFIELSAKKVNDGPDQEEPNWQVEISGAGKVFESLRGKLTAKWKAMSAAGEQDSDWPTPTTFLAAQLY